MIADALADASGYKRRALFFVGEGVAAVLDGEEEGAEGEGDEEDPFDR